ncbi:MAG: carboxypeptidase regulatory-like domain-containing protein, partial [Lewinellaceae bacterium]|nr:carboxypeptidase regulatory-like domain-containing protein [Lewinellaceae bacterium]
MGEPRENLYLYLLVVFCAGIELCPDRSKFFNRTCLTDDSGEPAISASVAGTKAGLSNRVLTDFDGNLSFSNVNPGTYDVEASYVGLNTQRVTGVVVYS